MPLVGGFSIGRWFGFRISIDYSWFLVFALVLWTFSAHEFPRQLPGRETIVYYAMGAAAAVLFFLSVLLHELAHSAMARARGIEVEGITLFIFGGVAQTRMEASRALDEFLLTVVGPLSSLALAAAFYGLGLAAEAAGWPEPVSTVAVFLALLNLVLAVFNMFPGFPLDGGRIFRSIVWGVTGNLERATRWATWGGRGFGWLLIAFGAVQLFYGYLLAGLWSIFIGWFLSHAAASAYRQFVVRRTLSRVEAGRVMAANPVAVDPDMTVGELVERYFLQRPEGAYPVVANGAVLGLVGVEDVSGLTAEARAGTRVAEVMRRAGEVPVAKPSETLDAIVSRVDRSEERVLVVEDGRLVGLLALGEVGRWIDRLRQLGDG